MSGGVFGWLLVRRGSGFRAVGAQCVGVVYDECCAPIHRHTVGVAVEGDHISLEGVAALDDFWRAGQDDFFIGDKVGGLAGGGLFIHLIDDDIADGVDFIHAVLGVVEGDSHLVGSHVEGAVPDIHMAGKDGDLLDQIGVEAVRFDDGGFPLGFGGGCFWCGQGAHLGLDANP